VRLPRYLPWLVVAGAALTAPAISCAAPAWEDLGLRAPAIELGLVADPAHAGVVLAPGGHGAVRRSTDGGRSFRSVRLGDAGNVELIVAGNHANPGMFAVTASFDFRHLHLWRSRDGGRHFGFVANLPPSELFDGSLALDTRRAGVMYLAPQPVEVVAPVLRSTDGGRHWRRIAALRHAAYVASFATDPLHPGRVYAVGSFVVRGHGTIGVSDDSGRTWRDASQGLGHEVGGLTLEVDGTRPGWLVAHLLNDTLAVSRNGGRSWRRVPRRIFSGRGDVAADRKSVV